MECELIGFEVENLRGFKRASLRMDRPVTLLVGPNNSGKTSLLRLINWAVNLADDGLLRGGRSLSPQEVELLLPARDTRGSARRLMLLIHVPDGRHARRFGAQNHIVRLRFRVVGDGVYVAVSSPRRSETRESENRAIEILAAVRDRTALVLVPASRDAESTRFRDTLGAAIRAKLEERGLHAQRGGAPVHYRRLKGALDEIRDVATELVTPLWDEMSGGLLPGLAKVGDFTLEATPHALVEWMVAQIRFTLSTGLHDVRTVSPGEVGSGLQSLLDLAVLRSTPDPPATNTWLRIEEPEAFLHPSAQRSLATAILGAGEVRRVVSTHSPLIVEEAKYGDVVLVRDHRVFEPRVSNERRTEINTALVAGMGAEALFARSVLLVEGIGDRAFFEVLRRRVARVDGSGISNTLTVVAVGGKSRFGPWIQLIRSYIDEATGEQPIRWLAVADSIDATTDLVRGVRDGGVSLALEVARLAADVTRSFSENNAEAGLEATRLLNDAAERFATPIALMPIDIEWAALQNATPSTVRRVCEGLALPRLNLTDLLRKLGSKHGPGPTNSPLKADWSRAVLAEILPWAQVSSDVELVLRRWLMNAFADRAEVDRLLAELS